MQIDIFRFLYGKVSIQSFPLISGYSPFLLPVFCYVSLRYELDLFDCRRIAGNGVAYRAEAEPDGLSGDGFSEYDACGWRYWDGGRFDGREWIFSLDGAEEYSYRDGIRRVDGDRCGGDFYCGDSFFWRYHAPATSVVRVSAGSWDRGAEAGAPLSASGMLLDTGRKSS